MIGIAYLLLLVPLLAWSLDERVRHWARRVSPWSLAAARTAAALACFAVALTGMALVSAHEPGESNAGRVMGLVLIAGVTVFLLGLTFWFGRPGRTLRVAGWIAMVAVLVIPSTLTLLLAIVGPLVLFLCEIPRRPSATVSPAPPT